MGRRPRVLYDGAIYHVIQRGNNRTFIYNDQLDKAKFCDLIHETMNMEDYSFKLLYYVLMDNHFHLLIETPSATIDRIMHRINMLYTKYYNKKYGRCGTLYDGRYTASLIAETRYLIQVIRYIANNPVRAGLVKIPSDYRWCAHLDVISYKKGLVDVDSLLGLLHENPPKAMEIYLTILSPEQSISKSILVSHEKNHQKRMTSLELLFRSHVKDKNLRELICSNDRSASVSELRRGFTESAYTAGYYVKEIAELLNLSLRGVRFILSKSKVQEIVSQRFDV
jgi:REP element-mobilizing transposase RayT